ncbi:MAG: hypothetical protein ACW99G_20170 [Candidatus Thorarchaeota archaeon]|jgi:hypothetical protein
MKLDRVPNDEVIPVPVMFVLDDDGSRLYDVEGMIDELRIQIDKLITR